MMSQISQINEPICKCIPHRLYSFGPVHDAVSHNIHEIFMLYNFPVLHYRVQCLMWHVLMECALIRKITVFDSSASQLKLQNENF